MQIKENKMTTEKMKWEESALDKYKEMIKKIPAFHRSIAIKIVEEQAVVNAKDRGSDIIEEEDIVKAFLCEVPAAFYSLMIRLMDDVGFNYKEFENKNGDT